MTLNCFVLCPSYLYSYQLVYLKLPGRGAAVNPLLSSVNKVMPDQANTTRDVTWQYPLNKPFFRFFLFFTTTTAGPAGPKPAGAAVLEPVARRSQMRDDGVAMALPALSPRAPRPGAVYQPTVTDKLPKQRPDQIPPFPSKAYQTHPAYASRRLYPVSEASINGWKNNPVIHFEAVFLGSPSRESLVGIGLQKGDIFLSVHIHTLRGSSCICVFVVLLSCKAA